MGATVLLHAGLVTKTADPADGRREIISLTSDGHARLHEVALIRERDLARMLASQLTDADRCALEHTLAVLNSLTSVMGPAPGAGDFPASAPMPR